MEICDKMLSRRLGLIFALAAAALISLTIILCLREKSRDVHLPALPAQLSGGPKKPDPIDFIVHDYDFAGSRFLTPNGRAVNTRFDYLARADPSPVRDFPIKNEGNTCYANAAMQVLMRSPGIDGVIEEIFRSVLDATVADLGSKALQLRLEIAAFYVALANPVWARVPFFGRDEHFGLELYFGFQVDELRRDLSTASIRRFFTHPDKNFSGGDQHDSFEFLAELQLAINADIFENFPINLVPGSELILDDVFKCPGEAPVRILRSTAQTFALYPYKFELKQRYETDLLRKLTRSLSTDSSHVLSLKELIELNPSDRTRSCTLSSGENVEVNAATYLAYLPQTLIVQMGRNIWGYGRTDAVVDSPAELEIQALNGQKAVYRLYATIDHRGVSAGSGHYVARYLNNTGHWMLANDSTLTKMHNPPEHSSESTVSFYSFHEDTT